MEDLEVHAIPFIKSLQAVGISFFYFPNYIVIQKKVMEHHEPLTHRHSQLPNKLNEEGKRNEETMKKKSHYKSKRGEVGSLGI